MDEPWHCMSCGALIYNLTKINGRLYPTSGAPDPHFASSTFPRVCRTCFDVEAVSRQSDYIRHLNEIAKKEHRKLGTGPDTNYLGA